MRDSKTRPLDVVDVHLPRQLGRDPAFDDVVPNALRIALPRRAIAPAAAGHRDDRLAGLEPHLCVRLERRQLARAVALELLRAGAGEAPARAAGRVDRAVADVD